MIFVTLTSFNFSRDEFAAVPNSAGYRKKRTCLLTFDLQKKKSSLGLPYCYMLIYKQYVRSCTSHWSAAQEVIKASVSF